MNKDSTMFKSIMNTSAYMVLHRLLQRRPDQMFSLTDQELDDILKYDILSIYSSYYNRMNTFQKKYVVEILESETEFRDLSLVLDNLSVFTRDEIYTPYLLKLVDRINVHPVIRSAYQVLFKCCTNVAFSHKKKGVYLYDYLALMNAAYFSVLADELGLSNSYTQCMEAGYGHCSYDDYVEYLFEKYEDDPDWDAEIDLNEIDQFLEKNEKDKLFKEPISEEDSAAGAAEYFDIVSIVANLRGENILQARSKDNDAVLSLVVCETRIQTIQRTVISGFDCCFCESEYCSESYVIIQRLSSYYRMLIYDNASLDSFLEEINRTAIKLDMTTNPVHIFFIRDEEESIVSEEKLRDDSTSFPRYVFSEGELISFLQDTYQRYFKKDDGYRLYIVDNRWIFDDSLYVPYLKIATVKIDPDNNSTINIKVVFYESGKKKLWAEATDYDTNPERWKVFGLIKASSFSSSQGYKNRIHSSALPKIYAEIFVNDKYYGEVSINCSYEEIQDESLLLKTSESGLDKTYIRKTQKPFYPIVTAKYWEKSNSLFVPYLKIDVINQTREPANLIYVYVIFYDVANRNLWSTSSSLLVSSGDTPLKQGFRKTAFLKAAVGYESRIDKELLASITAEIYINSEFYGTTIIDSDYEYNQYELPLNENSVTIDND